MMYHQLFVFTRAKRARIYFKDFTNFEFYFLKLELNLR